MAAAKAAAQARDPSSDLCRPAHPYTSRNPWQAKGVPLHLGCDGCGFRSGLGNVWYFNACTSDYPSPADLQR